MCNQDKFDLRKELRIWEVEVVLVWVLCNQDKPYLRKEGHIKVQELVLEE